MAARTAARSASRGRSPSTAQVTAPKVVTRRTAVLAAALVALNAGLFLQYTGPQRTEASLAKTNLTSGQEQLATVQAQVAKLQAGGQDPISVLYAKARKADELLPAKVDSIELVRSIPTLAASYGLKVGRFTPGSAGASGTVKSVTTVPFDTEMTGSMPQLSAFLTRLASLPQLMTVSTMAVTVAPNPGGEPTFSAAMTIVAWGATDAPLPAATVTDTQAAGTAAPPASPTGQQVASATCRDGSTVAALDVNVACSTRGGVLSQP